MGDLFVIVIFSGYNQRAIIAFLRCLSRNNISNYTIVASSSNDPIFKTQYKGKVFYTRQIKELNFDEIKSILERIKAISKEKILIAPSTEALNRFFLSNRDVFEKLGCIIPLVNEDLYKIISDKNSFWKLCKDKGLLVPKIINLSNVFKDPYVAKPKEYLSHNGIVYSPILVTNQDIHNDFVSHYPTSDFDYQEFLSGESYYLLFYFSNDGFVYKYSQQNIAQQPNGKSILIAQSSDIHKQKISDEYVDLLNSLNFRGFIMIELRKYNNAYYMIEANPRFWGPSQLFEDANAKLFDYFLADYNYMDKSLIVLKPNFANYFWSGGFKDSAEKDNDCSWLIKNKVSILKNINQYKKYDVYNRLDTIGIYDAERNK